jgi:hypothetical protein
VVQSSTPRITVAYQDYNYFGRRGKCGKSFVILTTFTLVTTVVKFVSLPGKGIYLMHASSAMNLLQGLPSHRKNEIAPLYFFLLTPYPTIPPKMVDDRGPTVLMVTCFVIVLSTLFVLLRFISRIVFVRQVSSDDYCMAAAWVRYRRFLGVDVLAQQYPWPSNVWSDVESATEFWYLHLIRLWP